MKKKIAALGAALVVALTAPTAAHASDDWYWSEQRAELALETYDEDADATRDGADCWGLGHSIRGKYVRRLYRRFYCYVYDPSGVEVGSGEIKVTGSGLRRYRWLDWDSA